MAQYEEIMSAAEEIFGCPIQADDDFFSLGGDSLNGLELCVRIGSILGREVQPPELWAGKTFSDAARHLSEPGS